MTFNLVSQALGVEGVRSKAAEIDSENVASRKSGMTMEGIPHQPRCSADNLPEQLALIIVIIIIIIGATALSSHHHVIQIGQSGREGFC